MRSGYKYGCDPELPRSFQRACKGSNCWVLSRDPGWCRCIAACVITGSPHPELLQRRCLPACQVLTRFHSTKENTMCRVETGLKLGSQPEPTEPASSGGGNSVLRQKVVPPAKMSGGLWGCTVGCKVASVPSPSLLQPHNPDGVAWVWRVDRGG